MHTHTQNERITTMREKELFPVVGGPCVRGLENELAEMGAQRQAYYAGTFVGNHVRMVQLNTLMCIMT